MQIHTVQKGELVSRGMEFRARVMNRAFGLALEHDPDHWDEYAWHIVATQHNNVVGYYRAMQSEPLGFCTEVEFDLTMLDVPKSQILEIGRAAADPQHPTVIFRLWRAVLELADRLNKRWIMGTASLKVSDLDVGYLSDAWRQLYGYDQQSHAVPRIPYRGTDSGLGRDVPPLIKTYEKIGARIVSDPGWDPRFQTADVVTLLDRENIATAWRKKLINRE